MNQRQTRRRGVLRQGGLLAALLACGLLASRSALARADNLGFDATSLPDVLRALGGVPAAASQLVLSLPDTVENGAFVPVAVSSALPDTEEICIVVESNPFPLAVRFLLPAGTEPYVATRLKLAASCRVHAVVLASGRLYSTSKATQVTLGGCG